jgi:hypothetical protein
MSVQPINTTLMNVPQLLSKISKNNGASVDDFSDTGTSLLSNPGNSGTSGSVLTSDYLSINAVSMQFQNNDGDSVMLSAQSLEYQKTMLASSDSTSVEDWKKLVQYLKEQYTSLKEEIIKGFLKSNGVEVKDTKSTDTANQTSDSADIPGLPEYWNAENTSQRIVDFATSFLSMFKGSGQDFLAMIKDAIDKGFSQAKDITGDLPDAVSKLVGNTHDLVMKKLDAWAAQQGITTGTDQQTPEKTVAQAA